MCFGECGHDGQSVRLTDRCRSYGLQKEPLFSVSQSLCVCVFFFNVVVYYVAARIKDEV